MASPGALISRGSRFSDYLTNLHFHLLDVSFKIPTVFNLSFGFRFCSAPGINIDLKEIKEGTYEFKKPVVIGASAEPITLHQGAQIFNSDFFDWVNNAIQGTQGYRRNLILLHFTDISPFGVGEGATGADGPIGGTLLNQIIPLNDLISRVPGRAWMLKGCIPTHYKGGSDFDPLSADISIMELTLQPQSVEEFSMGI